jgi:hypothetical protein
MEVLYFASPSWKKFVARIKRLPGGLSPKNGTNEKPEVYRRV